MLVNIGNKIPNQLPSKIFSYFSTGRPILNVRQLPVCPADAYMQRYPLACTVDAADACAPDTVRRVAAFLSEKADKRVSSETVARMYAPNTPQAVAQKLLEALTAARGERTKPA